MKRLVKKATPVLYHGTSDVFLDSIKEKGLAPGSSVGNRMWDESDTRYVYVSEDYDGAAFYAQQTAGNFGGNPIVLELSGLDPSKIYAIQAEFEEDVAYYYDIAKYLGIDEDEDVVEEYLQEHGLKPSDFISIDNKTYYYDKNNPQPPFVGDDVFNVLHLTTAAYRGTIPFSQIIVKQV